MKTCRLLIADEHDIMRYALDKLFTNVKDITICGVASNGDMLLEKARELQPDVILTELTMPGKKLADVTRTITREMPATQVIVFSSCSENSYITEVLEAGARGWLLKNEDPKKIPEAVRTVSRGEEFFSSAISSKYAALLAENREIRIRDAAKPVEFKEREMEVITLVCRGLSSKEIGHELSLSPRTVEAYQESIMTKMGMNNKVGVVLYAIRHGLFVL